MVAVDIMTGALVGVMLLQFHNTYKLGRIDQKLKDLPCQDRKKKVCPIKE